MTTRLEPVAWRFWHEGGWNYSATDPSIHLAPCVEIEPLYAAAPAPEGMREAIARLVERACLDYQAGHTGKVATRPERRARAVSDAADAILAITTKETK